MDRSFKDSFILYNVIDPKQNTLIQDFILEIISLHQPQKILYSFDFATNNNSTDSKPYIKYVFEIQEVMEKEYFEVTSDGHENVLHHLQIEVKTAHTRFFTSSQVQQDLHVVNYFQEKKNGVYVGKFGDI